MFAPKIAKPAPRPIPARERSRPVERPLSHGVLRPPPLPGVRGLPPKFGSIPAPLLHATNKVEGVPLALAAPPLGAIRTDPLEREADEIAERVSGQRDRASPRQSPSRSQEPAIPPIVQDVVSRPGQSLTPEARAALARIFGREFTDVRVHIGPEAAASARAVGASAYTVGQDIVFAADRYRPDTRAGQGLIAHELVHVVQQSDPPSTGAAEHSGLVRGRGPIALAKQEAPADAETAAADHIRKVLGVDPYDLALRAGLGPISMVAFKKMLLEKGLLQSAAPPPAPRSSGMAIGPLRPDLAIHGRIINVLDESGEGTKRVYVQGNDAELDRREDEEIAALPPRSAPA